MKLYPVIYCIIILLLLSGCDTKSKSNTNNADKDMIDNIETTIKDDSDYNMSEIYFFETESTIMPCDYIEFPVDTSEILKDNEKFQIKTKNDATEVGKLLLKRNQEIGEMQNFDLISITHATKDNIWKFNYSVKHQEQWTDSGGICITIDGNTGNILAAWAEE